MTLVVLDPGPLSLVQDLGRPGLAALGVGRSGAADRGGLRRLNRLLGNDDSAAGVECLLGGLRVRAERPLLVAVTGALVRVDGRPEGGDAHVHLSRGQVLALHPGPSARPLLAVRGGVAVPPVLGSRSCDTLSGLGPAPLRAGDRLPVGSGGGPLLVDLAPAPRAPDVLRLLPGPRPGWAQDPRGRTWTVSPDSDRVGLRLSGPPLRRLRTEELPSEGLLPGALQVPPDGQPVLFLADAPVTGGYPVVGVLGEADLDAAARLRPGDALRFA